MSALLDELLGDKSAPVGRDILDDGKRAVVYDVAPFKDQDALEQVFEVEQPVPFPEYGDDLTRALDEQGAVTLESMKGKGVAKYGDDKQFTPLLDKLGTSMENLSRFGIDAGDTTDYTEQEVREILRRVLRML